MQEQPKKSRNLFSIIVGICIFVVFVVGVIVWRNWEAKHREELKSSLITEPVVVSTEPETQTVTSVAERKLPEDPEALLSLAEEALKDEGYFESDNVSKSVSKGFQVYHLLKKALDCNCDVQKAEELCQCLKECSEKSNYGTWFVSSDLFAELDEKIKEAKES